MTPNASAAADRNTKALTIMVEPPPSIPFMSSYRRSMSDPEVAHFVHRDIAEHHPDARHRQAHLRQILIPHDGVEIRRHDVEQKEDRDRQAGEKQRGEFSLGGKRLDLAPHLEALADHVG